MSFQSWLFWDARRLRSEMVCLSAHKAGFAASAWASSTASSKSGIPAWDDVAEEGGADGRAAEDDGKSWGRRGGVAEAPFMIEKRPLAELSSNEPFWEDQTWRRNAAVVGLADYLWTCTEPGEEMKERREDTGQLWDDEEAGRQDEGERTKERVRNGPRRATTATVAIGSGATTRDLRSRNCWIQHPPTTSRNYYPRPSPRMYLGMALGDSEAQVVNQPSLTTIIR